jgi:hypothetical protein
MKKKFVLDIIDNMEETQIEKCICLKDVRYSLDKSIIWLESGKIVDFIKNSEHSYYIVHDGLDDYQILLEDEFLDHFQVLDFFRNKKINEALDLE